jgi:menaquinol-cytochrome c reductase iron-sulfur subunit
LPYPSSESAIIPIASPSGMDTPDASPPTDRRDFITKATAVVIGGSLVIAPTLAGLCVVLDPLRRKSESGASVLVANLNSLPETGEPRKFSVLATRVDAWNRTPNVPVGAVYLQRLGDDKVRALNVVCPHAGCFVDYRPANDNFFCPCHNSSFALDGRILDPKSPSPRGLDELPVEVRNGTEVWVTFQNFRAGVHEKIPV